MKLSCVVPASVAKMICDSMFSWTVVNGRDHTRLKFCFCNVFEDMLLWSSMGFHLV